jgi:hypothetical protein
VKETPILTAASHGFCNVIHALVEAGASLPVSDWVGNTPLTRVQSLDSNSLYNDRKEECHQTLAYLQQAIETQKKIKGTEERATKLRELGNLHYQKMQFEKAVQIYAIFGYLGRLSNLWEPIGSLRQNRQLPAPKWNHWFRRHFKYTFNDASKAVTMEKERILSGSQGLHQIP